MTESKTHTPEPWGVHPTVDNVVRDANGHSIVWCPARSNAVANAHHIVACVNACEGINPEAVPDLLEALTDMLPLALAHLQYLALSMEESDCPTDDGLPQPEAWELSKRYYQARAAIAKAEGR